MSRPMNLAFARKCADRLVARLQPACERIEIAGSIRRRRPQCGDIDLVIVPKLKPVHDLFGNVVANTNLAVLEIKKVFTELKGLLVKDGDNYMVIESSGIQVDIWFGTAETFGTLWMCRTGSKAHNIWLATGAAKRGGHWNPHQGLRVAGKTWSRTEEEIYAAIGVPFLPPEARDFDLPTIRA